MKFFIIIIFTLVVEGIFSQRPMLKLTPACIIPFGISNFDINTPANSGFYNDKLSKFGNVYLGREGLQGISWGIQADLFQVNEKFTLGLNLMGFSDVTGSKVKYKADTSNFIYPSGIQNSTGWEYTYSGNRLQLGINGKYKLSQVNSTTGWMQHYLNLELFGSFNRTNEVENFSVVFLAKDGIITSSHHENTDVTKKLGISLNLRYDFEFITKTSRKNILNLFVGYQQGFNVIRKHTFNYVHQNGMYMDLTSKSRNSGFYVGISKSISIIKPKSKIVENQ